ncbi:hypothetical protein B0H11DRAFT_2305774 [Mycena galericulata]|nr:hypothetical protein B0H11DRAFT_2305774 [Mycena galericulata]
MPTTNYTIDDVNPMIQYAPVGAWSAGDPSTDPSGMKYSNNGTFTLCTTKGSSASFSFNGTQVWVYGAKRSNHGPYSVQMDGKTTQYDGFSTQDEFTYLFSSGPLASGQHTVVVTNAVNDTTKPYLDIDYIIWSTDSSAVAENITLEDTISQFSYQPSNTWTTTLPSSMSGFQSNTGHLTQQKDASVILSFSGDTVSVYGAVGPTLGPYSIKMDGQSMGTFNATRQNYGAQIPLWHADNLGAGDHTLELINQPTSTGQGLAVDFALVAGLPATASASASGSASASPSSAGNHSRFRFGTTFLIDDFYSFLILLLSDWELGLLIVGGISAVCLAATIVGLIYRQINRRERRRQAVVGSTDVAAFTGGSGAIGLKPMLLQSTDPQSETVHLLDPFAA